MNERTLRTAGTWTRTAAAVVALLVAGRFTFVAVSSALAKSSMAPPIDGSARAPRGTERSARPVLSSTSSAPVVFGTPIRMTAMVTAGPDRSDVFIDGANVGKSPYVGDISCRAGDTVLVRIVPIRGNPIEFQRPCTKGTLRVDESP